jgi:hypothetical protein
VSFFKTIKKDIDLKRSDDLIDPIQYADSTSPDLYFIAESPLSSVQIKSLKRDVYSSINNLVNIAVINTFPFKPTEKDLSKNIIKFYADNHIDFSEYIPPNSRIITLGRSLYAITESDKLNVEAFYDIIFNSSYFYDPVLKSYVFPTDAFHMWSSQNNYASYFAAHQI